LTAGDIIRMADFLNWPVEKLFSEGFVGLRPFGVKENLFEINLGLQIPCKFRNNKQCDIYEARPLNCRLFPYWVFADIPKEKIPKYVDESYECVHNVELDEKTLEFYKKYCKEIALILEEESKITERLLKKFDLIYEMDVSKQDGYSSIARKLTMLMMKYKGVEFEKKYDEIRIQFATEKIDREIPDKFIFQLNRLRENPNIFSIEKLRQLGAHIK